MRPGGSRGWLRSAALVAGAACGGGGPTAPPPAPTPAPQPSPSPTPPLPPPNPSARCGDPYPDQRSSPFILPYPVGASFNVGQGNCTDGSHSGADRFAYDFDMPIGTPVLAVRGGSVRALEERFRDGNRAPGEENFVTVVHDDGSVAEYFHLTREGVLVEGGARVAQGDVIARSGDTGDSTEPHLHFQVSACAGCSSMPVTFRNTRPHPQGLVEGEEYRAEPF